MSSIIASIFAVATLAIFALIFSSLLDWPKGLVLGGIVGVISFFVIACVWSYIYEVWYFQVYYYELTDDYITIRKRVFTPREITIPYGRVQDVNVDQDLLDRFYGLYDVHLTSATVSSAMEAHIDGVEKEAADGLRDKILRKLQEKLNKSKF